MLDAAALEYKQVAQKDCKLVISTEQYLPPDRCVGEGSLALKMVALSPSPPPSLPFSAGGVELQIPGGTIRVSNTLESRLQLISGQVGAQSTLLH